MSVRSSGTGDPGDEPVDRRDVAAAGNTVSRHFCGSRSGWRREEEVKLSRVVAFAGVVIAAAEPALSLRHHQGGVVAFACVVVSFTDPALPFRSARGIVGRICQRLLDLSGRCRACCDFGWDRVERRKRVRRSFLTHHKRHLGLEGAIVFLHL